jgi:hypothetical protein
MVQGVSWKVGFMEPESSLEYEQEPANGTCYRTAKTVESSPWSYTLFL